MLLSKIHPHPKPILPPLKKSTLEPPPESRFLRHPAQSGRLSRIAGVIASCCTIFLSACSPQPVTAVLFDFESDAELDRFGWKCRSRFEISEDYSHTGRSSLRFEFHPAEQVGFSTGDVPRDWSRYSSFDFWVHNPSETTVSLHLQINRREPDGKFNHLIAETLEIPPGPRRVSVALCPSPAKGAAAGSEKDLLGAGHRFEECQPNLKRVDGFYIFIHKISEVTVLYFDSFGLH